MEEDKERRRETRVLSQGECHARMEAEAGRLRPPAKQRQGLAATSGSREAGMGHVLPHSFRKEPPTLTPC